MAVYQVVALQRVLGQEVRNIFYYANDATTLTTAQQEEIADEVRDCWADHIDNYLSNDWMLYGIDLRRVDAASIPSITLGFTAGNLAGTATAENVPTQIAMLVHGVAYVAPPNRVRSYLAGWTEGSLADGLFAAAQRTAALAWAGDMASLSITGLDPFIRVSAEWAPDHSLVVEYNPITSYVVEDVPATQRRRRIGRGA